MLKLLLLSLLCAGVLSSFTTKTAADENLPREAILLHNIKELEFTQGKFTASRRVSAVPQMECVGGSARRTHYEPLTARCVNIGQNEPHWRCEATLEDTVKLGNAMVTCEGYEGPHDPYVLRDSCGLKYTLEYSAWGSFLLGTAVNAFSFFVITPLKWVLGIAVAAFVALVITAAIRRPAHKQQSRNQKTQEEASLLQLLGFASGKVKHQEPEKEEDDEEEEEEEDNTDSKWVRGGRLRDRSQIHSPSKSVDSPSAQQQTGLAQAR